jgi:hypothetical protein
MKSKKTSAADGKGAQTGMDGVDGADGAAAMSGNGGAGQASLQMKSEIMAGGADPNDRGMPGLTRRGQQEDMPQSAMDTGQGADAGAMPEGGKGARTGSGGGGRAGGGDSGMGGGGGDDSGDGGGSPRVRSCGTMDVHRRLLSSDPAYARAQPD